MAILYTKYNLDKLEGAYAPNTVKSYYADVMQFVDWCETQNLVPFPLSETVIVSYVSAVQCKIKYATIRRRLSALRRINKLMGHEDLIPGEDLHLALRRIRRSNPANVRQACGINLELLLRMINAQPKTLTGARNRALLSLGYDFLARRSELIALKTNDIEILPDGSVRAVIRRSKSDQFGRGRLVYGSARSAKLYRAWLKLKPKHIDWVFCAINHGQCLDRPICGRSVNDVIKKSVCRCRGERPRDREVSGHSLRVGAAQDLLIAGHDLAAIMRAGGWSDLSVVCNYLKYAEHNIWTTLGRE